MKKSILAVLAIVAFSFASCGDPEVEEVESPGFQEPDGGSGTCTLTLPDGRTFTGSCDVIYDGINNYQQ